MAYYRNGDPCARAVRDHELRQVRPFVTDALARYRHTPQVGMALQLIEELRNFNAPQGYTYQRETRHMLDTLERAGVTHWDILGRVVEVYEYAERNPSRFPSVEVMRHALARGVMRLVSLGRWRSQRRTLSYFGELIQQYIGTFALAFIRHVEKKFNERAKLIQQSAKFDEVSP